ncbi:DnaJ domain-containing protein [Alicyclobacillus sp. SO9]|uniref:DnaJ domain-containing protein n=1 Tax=Alicyclobacillus sp. SO9 TaxID=2665646 RepID=UPI0018E853AF|nr:DnaJ domain-containing protein [Alicyclobacillus sp. SO9]
MASNVHALQTQSLILRRCSTCKRINRVPFQHATTARCGICAGELSLSYYDILGVVQSAGPDEIKKAFHGAVQKWHPDKRRDNDSRQQHFQRIVAAYQTLRDPQRRDSYDKNEVIRIHVHIQQTDTRSSAKAAASPSSSENQTARHDSSPSTSTHPNPAPSTEPTTSSRTQIDATRQTVHLVATTSIMLLGVILWALFQRTSTNSNPLLLWIAIATGLFGVGKFLFLLSDR